MCTHGTGLLGLLPQNKIDVVSWVKFPFDRYNINFRPILWYRRIVYIVCRLFHFPDVFRPVVIKYLESNAYKKSDRQRLSKVLCRWRSETVLVFRTGSRYWIAIFNTKVLSLLQDRDV